MDLKEVISQIKPASEEAAGKCTARFAQVAKPVGSLGKLEKITARIAAALGTDEIDISRKAVAVFCADNGIARRGVTQHDHKTTSAIARLISENRSCVSVMAHSAGAEVFAFDVGMQDTVKGLRQCKLMHGTNDITQEPAMSRETAENAVLTGVSAVKELKDKGFKLIATGEVGMGNTAASSAVCSVLLNKTAKDVTGRGAGLSDEGLSHKIQCIEKAVSVSRPDCKDPIDVLSKVGGLDIAAMAGTFIGGAFYNIPIVMDGFISGTAALLAVRICPDVIGYIIPSHQSEEPGARILMEEMGFSPIINAGMRLGEGTGAAALFPLLDSAVSVYKNAATFADIMLGVPT